MGQRRKPINSECRTCGARRGIPCTKYNGQFLADKASHKYRGKRRPKPKPRILSREKVQQHYERYEARRLAEKARILAARS